MVRQNLAAVDRALEALVGVEVPATATSPIGRWQPVPGGAPEFVERVTARLLDGTGDLLP